MGQRTSSVVKFDVLDFTWDKRYIVKSAESKVKAPCRQSELLCLNYYFIPHIHNLLNQQKVLFIVSTQLHNEIHTWSLVLFLAQSGWKYIFTKTRNTNATSISK